MKRFNIDIVTEITDKISNKHFGVFLFEIV